jgi:filamentous hemagglutinin
MNFKLRQIISYTLIFLLAFNPLLLAAKPRNSEMQQTMVESKDRLKRAQEIANHRTINTASRASERSEAGGIQVDLNADTSNQAGLKYAANGTQVIDISQASQGGVSHNKFTNYNVSADGVILNNSVNPLLSVLGGWTDGNRRLSGSTAKIILAEVTGNSGSSLLGYSEILGDSAEFVLANQNGITCNGCGFINTPKVTLTTGIPAMINGRLQGFDISKGSVIFDGSGMNASNVGRLDILTQAIVLNASLYGDHLNLVTGLNYYDYTTGEVSQLASQGGNVDFALDASILGGMYANNITLLGTEVGVGVRSEGMINAVQDMELTTSGELRLKDTSANQSLTLVSTDGDIVTTGDTYGANVKLTANGTVLNQGTLAARDEIAIEAMDVHQGGEIYSGVDSEGQLQAGASLSIKAQGSIINQGRIVNVSGIELSADSMTNSSDASMQSQRLDINTNSLVNQGNLSGTSLSIAGLALINSGHIQGEELSFNLDSLVAEQGVIYQYGELGNFSFDGRIVNLKDGILVTQGLSDIKASDSIINQGDWLAQGALNVVTDSFTNTGTLEAQSLAKFDVNNLNNSGNLLFVAQQAPELAIASTLNNDHGLLQLNSDSAKVSASKLTNQQGQILHLGDGTFSVDFSENLDNSLGKIWGSNLDLTSALITNNQGTIQGNTLAVKSDKLINQQGVIVSFERQGESLLLDVEQEVDNVDGVIQSFGDDLSLTSQSVNNQGGQIIHNGTGMFSVDTQQLNNDIGLLWAEADLSIATPAFINRSGQVSAAGQLDINTDRLSNHQGLILGGHVTLAATDVINDEGIVEAKQVLNINANGLSNLGGMIRADLMALNVTNIDNQGSVIADILQLNALNLANSGSITTRKATLTAAKFENNGLISAMLEHSTDPSLSSELQLNTDKLVNHGSIMTDSHDFSLTKAQIDNQGGTLAHSGQGVLTLNSLAELNNASGAIFTSGSLVLDGTHLDNNQGVIQASKQAELNVNSMNNVGGKLAVLDAGALAITLVDDLNNQGGNISAGQMAIAAKKLVNNGGSIQAFNDTTNALNLNLNHLNNLSEGIIASAGGMQIIAADLLNGGTVVSHGAMSLKLASLLNASASGIGAADLSLDVDNIINQGTIQARDTRITSVNISNQGQILIDGSLKVVSQSLDNNKGLLQVGDDTQIEAAKISNRAGEIVVTAGERLDISASLLLDNSQGSIASNALDNHLQGSEINNTQGRLEFYQNLELSGGKLVNHQGLIAANEGYLDFDELDNTLSGRISAVNHLSIDSDKLLSDGTLSAGTLTLNVEELEHKGGQIVADTLSINSQSFSNSGVIASGLLDISAQDITNLGELNASQTLHLSATELNNLGGVINSQGSLMIEANSVLNHEGNIYAGKLNLKGDTLVNDRGEIATFSSQDNSLAISLTQELKNQAGLIYVAGGNGAIEANTITNSGEITYAGQGKLSVIAGMLSNLDSAVLSSVAGLDIVTETLDNKGILKAGVLGITSDEVNNSGVMLADNLDMTTQELNNGGIIEAGQGHLTLTNLINNGQLLASEQAQQVAGIANPSLVIETESLISKGIIGASDLSLNSRVVDNQGDINALKLTLTSESLNNTGNMLVAGGTINTDSTINRGKIALVGDGVLTLDAASALDNQQGQIFSEGQLRLNTAALTNLDGLIQSAGGLGIVASEYDNTRGQLLGSGERLLQLDVGNLNNQAGVIAAQRLVINAQAVDNTSLDAVFGQILASDISLNTTELDNSHGLVLADKLSVTADSLVNNQGRIEAKQSFLMTISQLLDNRQGELVVMAENGDISAGSLNNDSGLIIHQGNGSLGLTVSELLQNTQGVISSAEQLQLSAASLDNRGGTLIHGGNGSLSFVDLFNQGGQIYGMGDLAVTGQSLDNSSGVLQVQGNADFILNILNNRAGEISVQGQTMSLQIADALDNQQGKIIAQGDLLQLQAGSINNQNGVLAVSQQLSIIADSISNDAGFIRAEDKVTMQAQSMSNNAGGLLSAANVTLSGQQLDNQSGVIESSNSLSLGFDNINNQSGLVLSKGQHFSLSGQFDNSQAGLLEVHSTDWQTEQQSIDNQGGTLRHMGSGALLLAQEQQFNNQSGTITSLGDIHLNLGSGMNNQQGLVQASADIKLAALGNVDNRQGRLIAEGVMNVTAEGLDNRAGKVLAANGTNLQLSAELSNQDGLLYNQAGETNIIADTINNANGVLTQQGIEAFIVKATTLSNQGEISAQNLLSIESAKLQNHGVIGSTELTLKGQEVRNSGTLVAELLRLNATGLDNRDGTIYASGSQGASLVLETQDQINNQSGLIQSKGQALTLASGVDNTQGEILLLSNGVLTAANVINDNGKLLSSGAIALSGNVSNQAGTIEALTDVNIYADNVNNSAGSIHANNQLTLTANSLVNQAGRITGSGTVYRLDSQSIDNRNGGVIATDATDMLIKVNSLNNQAGTVMHQGSGKLTVAHAGASGTGVINNNAGTLVTQGQLDLLGNALSNDNGLISSQGAQGLTLASLSNTAGRIESAADLAMVLSGNVSNQHGIIFAANSLDLRTDGALDNASGVLLANTTAKLNAGSIVNDAGTVQAQTVSLNSLGRLSNQGGAISGTQVNLGATELNNTAGTILATGSDNNALNMLAVKSLNNSQGTLASYAQNWDMVLNGFNNTEGKIVHQGRGALSLSNVGNLHNAGDIVSNGDLLLSASTVNNQGQLQAANRLNINGGLNNSASGVLAASSINVAGGSQRIDNAGSLSAITSLNFNAAVIDNAGLLYSQQGLELTAGQIANTGTVSAANLTAKGFATLNNSGRIESNSASFIGDELLNDAGVIASLSDQSMNLRRLSSVGGHIESGGSLGINVQTSANNQAGVIYGANSLIINSGEGINNNAGVMLSNAEMRIEADAIANDTGTIQAQALTLSSRKSVSNVAGVISATQMKLTAEHLNNGRGTVLAIDGANSYLDLTEVGSVDNTQGAILLLGNGVLTAANVINDNGKLLSSGAIALSGNVSNQAGTIEALTDVNIYADNVNNSAGSIHANNQLTLTANSLVNQAGRITGSGTVYRLDSQSIDNRNGGVIATDATDMLIKVNSLNNQAGTVMHQGSGKLTVAHAGASGTGVINNNAGTLVTQGQLDLLGNALSNDNGLISSQGAQGLTLASLSNTAGRIESAADLAMVLSGNVSNQHGIIFAANSLDLRTDGALDNASGVLLANTTAKLNAGSIVNDAGTVQAQTVSLNSLGRLSNQGGAISGTQVNLGATELNNTAGTILATGSDNNALNMLAVKSLNNSQGTLASYAQNWDMVLNGFNNTEGKIVHQGRGALSLSNVGNLHNAGDIVSNGDLLLSASTVNNQGQLQAANRLNINGGLNNSASGVLAASSINVAGGSQRIDNAGSLSAITSLNFNAAVIDNAGLLYSQQGLELTAGQIANSGTVSAANLSAKGFATLNNSGRIEASNASFSGTNLTNAQTGVLVASGSSASALILGVSQLVNRGTLYNSGVDMRFAGSMTNSGQLIHAGTGNLVIGENGSTNLSGGVLSTAGTANLKGNISGAGQLFAKKGINIDTVNTFTNTNTSLYTQGNLQINSAVNNQGGTLVADGTLAIKTSGHVDNSKGVIQGRNIDIAAASLGNNQGTITSLGGGSGQIVAGSIDNSNGKIQSSNSQFTLSTLSGNLTNNSGVISHNGTGVLTLDSKGNLEQQSGMIQTSGDLQLRASGDINNNNGVILASQFDINASGAFSNASGQLIGFNDGNSSLSAAAIDNRQGTISNDGNSLSLLSQGALDNTGGNISSSGSGSLNINATSIKNDNATSYLLSNGAININAGSNLTNSGMISALTGLTINAANINNREMLASRSGATTLNLSAALTNTGIVSGKTAVDIQSSAINNTSGVLQSDGLVKLASQSLNAGIVNGQDLDIVLGGGLALASLDKLSASRNITVNTNGNNINNQGSITASGLANISGLNLTNGGRISAGSNSTLNFNDIANTGILSSNSTLTVNSNISSNSGTLAAANTLDINGNVNNSNLLFAGSNLSIDGNVSNSSSIYSAGNGALTGTITNNAGSIAAVNNLSLTGNITNNRSGSTTFSEGETTTTVSGGGMPFTNGSYNSSGKRYSYVDKVTRTTTVYNATATGNTGIIAAGGDLSLSGNITNNYSTISAGRNISLSGTNLTNNTAQNKQISDVRVIKETWVETCLKGNSNNNRYTCYEPDVPIKESESEIERYTETTYVGGAYGTIVAGGSITGNLSGLLEANDASPQTGDRYSANTQVSGTQGSASRGQAASANNQQSASINTTNGSSQSIAGQGRNAAAQTANVNSGVNLSAKNETVNGGNSLAIGARDDIGIIARDSVDANGSSQSIAGQGRNAAAQTANVNSAVNLSTKNETVNGGNSLTLVGGADNSVRASANTRDINQNIANNVHTDTAVRGVSQRVDFSGQDALSIASSVNGTALNLVMEDDTSQVQISSAGIKTSVSTVENGPVIDQNQQVRLTQAIGRGQSSDYQQPAQGLGESPTPRAEDRIDLDLAYVNGVEQINQNPLLSKSSHIDVNREQHERTGPGGLGVNAQAPEHKYQRAEGESALSEQDLLVAVKTLSNLENEVLSDHESRSRDAQGNHLTAMVSNSSNVFMSDAQVKVLTQGLGFDQSIIDDGQDLLYAVVGQKDLLVDGVTISAGTYMDISADKAIKIDAGIAANDGLILRTQGDIATLDTSYFDSDKLLGLQMGGDFTNTANLSSDTLWLDVGGNFINDASLTGINQLWLNSGGDVTNNANLFSDGLLSINAAGNLRNQQGLISGSDVMLNAGGDIINRTEFSQSTHTRGKNSKTYTFIGEESEIISTNSLTMNAGNNIDLQGSRLAANGDMSLNAANDVLLSAVENKSGSERYFGGGYEINHDTSYDVVDLQAGGNLAVIAGNNIESQGAQFIADGDITLAAENELTLNSVTESHIASSMYTDKGFFSTKVTTSASQHDTVQGSLVQAGGNILINAITNGAGQIAVQQTGNVNIIGSLLTSGHDTIIAGNDINVLAQSYTDFEMASKTKSAFWGLSTSANLDAEKTQKLSGSQIAANDDLTLISADDITIAGSDLFANGNINISAFDELLVTSADESSQVESKRESGGLFSGGSLFSSSENMQGEKSTTGYGSLVNAGGDINIDVGSATVVGSDIVASGNLGVRTDIGDIQVLAAKETTEIYSSERKLEIGFGDLLKGLTNPTELIKSEDGQLKFSIANATYDKVDFSSTDNSHKGSTLAANGNLTLDSVADILVEGSDLLANNGANAANSDTTEDMSGNLNLLAGGNVTIKEAENAYEESLEETHGSAEVSVVVQHQAVEVVKAALALKEATDKVKQSEQDYRTFKKQRDSLEGQLVQLEADYNSGTPGVNYADIIDMRELLEDVKGDEDWYIAGIALATADATMKGVNLAQQIIAGGATTAAYGFNAGIQLDIDASNTKSDLEQTTSLASNLSGNNINILTGLNQDTADGANRNQADISSTLIQGSHLNAQNAINISTGELSVLASRDTSSSSSETQNGHITIAQTIGGAAGGPTVSASYDRNQSKDKTTTYNNSTLTAGDINITTAGDTRIEGANLTADNRLNLDVGGDLLLESKQNRASGSNKGIGVSGGFGFNAGNEAPNSVSSAVGGALSSLNGGKTVATTNISDTSGGVGSVNGGLNASAGRYQNKETVLSSITGAEVNVNVAGNTNIVGALLASLNSEGQDNGKLSLATGSLSFTDLTNTRFNSQVSGGISANIGITTQTTQANDANAKTNTNTNTLPAAKVTGDGETSSNSLDVNSSQYTYSNESSYDKSKTLATLGQGTVLVGGVNADSASIDSTNISGINPAQGTASNALAGLNRDTDNIDKTFYSVDRQQGNIDITVDHEQAAVAADVTGEVMQQVDEIMPSALNENTLLAGVGSTIDILAMLTGGILPSDAGNGGLIAQIPVLLGQRDDAHLIGGDVNSKNVYMNGMGNTLADAYKGADNIIGVETDKMIWLNPTHGFLNDLIESAVDLSGNSVGIQTGISKQAEEFQQNNTGMNYYLHSQGHLIAKEGADPSKNNYFSYGAPMTKGHLMSTFGNSSLDYDLFDLQKNQGDYVAKPLNMLNPWTWQQAGHGTEHYGEAARIKLNERLNLIKTVQPKTTGGGE